MPSTVGVVDSSISGKSIGVQLSGESSFVSSGSTISGTGTSGIGLYLVSGDARLTAGTSVSGIRYGIRIVRDDRGGIVPSFRVLTIDAATVTGVNGSGIILDLLGREPAADARIDIRNGSTVSGGNGVAIELAKETTADVTVDRSTLSGSLRVADGGALTVSLDNGATLIGSTTGSIAATLGASSLWRVTGDSDVDSLALNGGTIAFQPSGDASHRSTLVRGDLSGTGGVVALNTTLDAGGPLSNQFTDRLLIQGDVTTTGPIQLQVVPTGGGANTDLNKDGVVDAHEGISLVQVGGNSRADAFTLRGGYVAAGPYQYTLHAFGPGEVDQAQNALPSGPLQWDYRLGNRIVCDGDCNPVEPENPDPGNPDPGNPDNPTDPGNPDPGVTPEEPSREAVVPQLPSYLSAPAALLTYGDMMNDGLRQRLGDIRQGMSHDPVGGEVFARYLGGQLRYRSNLSFQDYGYDFDQQVNALQLGGSLIALDGDNGTLRAGWAADHGTTRVTPKAADGNSSAKYTANGISGWVTWQHGNGLWVDGVIGATRYRGDIGTDLRGAGVGRIRANGWSMSVEVGKPFALGNDWTVEPRFQLKHQSLNFRDFVDVDGLDVKLGTAKQTSTRLGARLSRTANPVFMPYVGLDLTHTSNGDPSVDVSSDEWNIEDRFGSGRVGNSYRVAAGAVSQLGEHVQIYGEGTYQHFVGSYGMRGWAGNLGIRVSF
ncbi:autotransporter outer membrane beta-barrel domain-containing protein [Luteibacter flocculans]|uniref:Autotransporter outer membrane beta-barrel domain-containing protein n=1 Tax=Luteibacter flocculans TaxID=2780091 RepID=A0ABY4T5M8_9GAMM|nr:autotransporter outer membrane beta-barrel domain-containing protein [Luteibacter flocculans]URL60065.1 autotransporter outer membrane beta-barrel domain-containing protein [Luteibacter flocculans]